MENKKYDVAAYIWPAYTGDEPRTRIFWPEGMGEWQTVKNTTEPRNVNSSWPRRPVWGYVNEADPYVMEMEINAASDHGVNVFIYDWYWYDNRPFLENCLNDGYLKARNNDKVKFYLMWANHDVDNQWDVRTSHIQNNIIWPGAVNLSQFKEVCDRLIDKYLCHPSYYRIDNKPVFSIYDIPKLIHGLGGVAQARKALDWFRSRAVSKGLPGLHLQMIKYGDYYLIDAKEAAPEGVAETLGFDSLTHYQMVHFTRIDRDYTDILKDVEAEYNKIEKSFKIPYFPHVSIGWDNSPRSLHEPRIYTVKNDTPAAFEKGLLLAKAYADRRTQAPLVTVNSWNEWTETSYLLPDNINGYGYLKAVKKVFGNAD
ncbi:MAG: glycoside hydrolase family 99-like domain-containing protein [Firmicutes bacterium]|nr:glycoside hydrolase family 99-like domain-containing protein [Bacillota bacterium]